MGRVTYRIRNNKNYTRYAGARKAQPIIRRRDIDEPVKISNTDAQFDEGFYPDLEDPQFEQKIFNKREFKDLTLPADYLETIASAVADNKPFTLSNVQSFVSRFLSPATPYNSALLYHGVGVGKTCSAVSIAETFLAYDGGARRVHVIVPKHVEDAFRRTVFNTMLLATTGDIEETVRKQCTGRTYVELAVTRGTDIIGNPEQLARIIDKIIKRRYIFYSYQKFSNTIKNWQKEATARLRDANIDPISGKTLTEERRSELRDEEVRQRIDSAFSGSVIIIDEAHNLRVIGEKGGDNSENNVTNIPNSNNINNENFNGVPNNEEESDEVGEESDEANEEESGEVSEEEGDETNEEEIGEVSEEKIGEVSEEESIKVTDNEEYDDEDESTISTVPVKALSSADRKRVTEALRNVLRQSSGAKLVLLTATPMFNEAREIITLLNLLRLNDKRSEIAESDLFNSSGILTKEGRNKLRAYIRGYVSYMRGENPVTFPVRLYPDDILTAETYPATLDATGNELTLDKNTLIVPIHATEVGGDQYDIMTNVQDRLLGNRDANAGIPFTVADIIIQCSNIVFPRTESAITVAESTGEGLSPATKARFGMTGFRNYFRALRDTAKGKRVEAARKLGMTNTVPPVQYSTRNDDWESIRALLLPSFGGDLAEYSSKFADIIESVNAAEGVCLVAARWLYIGALLLALLLEMHGYERYVPGAQSGAETSLLVLSPEQREKLNATVPRKCALCSSPPEEHNENPQEGEHAFVQARYILLSGNKDISPTALFNASIDAARSDANIDGSIVKVVLGVRVVEEGLDLKFIREVHVVEPWFHLNRAEQIIGRGVRQYSHALLPPEKRNTSIFLHASVYPAAGDEWRETVDLYIYRLALAKAQRIGEVSRILKESAIDCDINYSGNHFPEHQQPLLEIDSRGVERHITLADRPGTSVCDYLSDCNYECLPRVDRDADEDISTYGIIVAREVIRAIQDQVRELFKTQAIWSAPQLSHILVEVQGVPLHIFYEALYEMANNPKIVVEFGQKIVTSEGEEIQPVKGYIVRRGFFYAFQPADITDARIPISQRITAPDKHADRYPLMQVVGDTETTGVAEEVIKEDDIVFDDEHMGLLDFVHNPLDRLLEYWNVFVDIMAQPAAYTPLVTIKRGKRLAMPDVYNQWIETALTYRNRSGENVRGGSEISKGNYDAYPGLAYLLRILLASGGSNGEKIALDKDIANELIFALLQTVFDTVMTWQEKRYIYHTRMKNGPMKPTAFDTVLLRLFEDVELKIPTRDGGALRYFIVPVRSRKQKEIDSDAKSKTKIKIKGKVHQATDAELRVAYNELTAQALDDCLIEEIKKNGNTDRMNKGDIMGRIDLADWAETRLIALSGSSGIPHIFGGNFLDANGVIVLSRFFLYHSRFPDKTTNIDQHVDSAEQLMQVALSIQKEEGCPDTIWNQGFNNLRKYFKACGDVTPINDSKWKNKGELKRQELGISKWAWCRMLEIIMHILDNVQWCGRRWFFRPTEFQMLNGATVIWCVLQLNSIK